MGNILDNMDPDIEIRDEALKYILYEQLRHSPAFDSEVKHYLRTDDDRNYRFLFRALERCLHQDRMERESKVAATPRGC